MGKGSGRRPKQISAEEEQARWDAAFGKDDSNNDECQFCFHPRKQHAHGEEQCVHCEFGCLIFST